MASSNGLTWKNLGEEFVEVVGLPGLFYAMRSEERA